jgi:uncharacterized LabA/DUF88 family protein
MTKDAVARSNTMLALLIDGDNLRAEFLPIIIREASAIGTVAIRRVYGHFASPSMRAWQPLLHAHALTPVHVPPATRGKNATDMKLAIDAMDMMHQKALAGFCIASSDSDFTALASRIREEGIGVYGFGEKKSAAPYIAACDRFFYCDLLLDEDRQQQNNAEKQAADLPVDEILSAVDGASADDGWATLAAVGNILTKRMPDFDPRNFGYRKLSDLVAQLKALETRKGESAESGPVAVRRRQRRR